MRGSVIGPLVLIGIGVLFLANNLRPELSLIELMAQFWPFLLIGWGAIRLIEIFVRAFARKPLPVSGVSGGEWVLIVFISLIGSGVFVARKHVGWWGPMNVRIRGVEVFGEAFDYTIEERRITPASKSPRIIVENFRGNARITGTDGPDVVVTGRKTVRAMKQSEADTADRESVLELNQQAGTIVIRTNQDRSPGAKFISADLEISVPRSATIEGRGRYGDFDINSIGGDVQITSDNAGVRVQSLDGTLRVDTRNSDIIRAIDVKGAVELKGRANDVELENIAGEVTLSGFYSGELQFRNLAKPLRLDDSAKMHTEFRVESCPGQIRIGRGYINGEKLIGPVIINARAKDIQLSEFTSALEVSLDRGDVELRPAKPLPRMDVTTRNGHIDVAMPEGSNFAMRATVRKGEVNNDYGSPLQVSEEGRGAVLTGTTGDGPSVTLVSERGSVTIRKGSGELTAPLTPAPPRPPRPAAVLLDR